MRVLIADDDRVMTQMLAALFQKRGHRVMAAYDAMQALMFASRDPRPDLLLLDINMPGGNGVRALERIRASSKTMSLPVIVISGSLDTTVRAQLEQLGVTGILDKPVDMEALEVMVEGVAQLL